MSDPNIQPITYVHSVPLYAMSFVRQLTILWARDNAYHAIHLGIPLPCLHPTSGYLLSCPGVGGVGPVKPFTVFGLLTHHLTQITMLLVF